MIYLLILDVSERCSLRTSGSGCYIQPVSDCGVTQTILCSPRKVYRIENIVGRLEIRICI